MGDTVVHPGHQVALNADILALVADSVICTDEEGRILVLNAAAEQTFGYAASEVIGKGVEILLPLSQRTEHIRRVHHFGLGEGTSSHLMGKSREVRGRRKNGEEFPAEAMLSRHTISDVTILTAVLRDITERKELEDLREAVAREQDHRLRNVLAVVNSLISLTAADAANVEEFRDTLVGRLKSLSTAQSALRSGKQAGTSLNELFQTELDQYRTADGTNIAVEGPQVLVGGTAAQILTLAAHELATNSAKYGALNSADGRVTVTLAYIGDDAAHLRVQWQETGGPSVRPPNRKGFGTELIKQLVGKALRSDVVIEYRPEGLVCNLTLPRATVELGRD